MGHDSSASTLNRRGTFLLAATVALAGIVLAGCSSEPASVTVHHPGEWGKSNGFTLETPGDWEIVVPDPPPAGLNDGESIAVLALYPPDSAGAVVAILRAVAPDNAESEAAVWSSRGQYSAFTQKGLGASKILLAVASVQTPMNGNTDLALAVVELPGGAVWSLSYGPGPDAEGLCLSVAVRLRDYNPSAKP